MAFQTGNHYFLHNVFPKMMITTTLTKIIPNEIKTKNASKTFSNKPIINIRTAITDIPTPIVLHFPMPAFLRFGPEVSLAYISVNSNSSFSQDRN